MLSPHCHAELGTLLWQMPFLLITGQQSKDLLIQGSGVWINLTLILPLTLLMDIFCQL